MKKLFGAAVALALVGCAGAQKAQVAEQSVPAPLSWEQSRERWDVIRASGNDTAQASAADVKKKEKENAGTGGSGPGLIDPVTINGVGLNEKTPAQPEDKAKERPRRRPLTPGAATPAEPEAAE